MTPPETPPNEPEVIQRTGENPHRCPRCKGKRDHSPDDKVCSDNALAYWRELSQALSTALAATQQALDHAELERDDYRSAHAMAQKNWLSEVECRAQNQDAVRNLATKLEAVLALVRKLPSPIRANHGPHWKVESNWECDWCGVGWSVTKGCEVVHPANTCLYALAAQAGQETPA